MENIHIQEYLLRLESQVKLLLESHSILKVEIEGFKQENQQLREQLVKKNEALENFQNQSKISKIVDCLEIDDNPEGLKEKIDEYIIEIDQCISYLNKEL